MNKTGIALLVLGFIFSADLVSLGQNINISPSPTISINPSFIPTSTPNPLIPKLTTDGNELIVPNINFDGNTDIISSSSLPSLTLVRDYLNQKTYITTMRIEAHVASEEDEAKNQELSSRRALAIARWFSQNGINCNRLIAVGFGSSKPVSGDNSSFNNRIQFYNAALRGRAIGGMPIDGGGISVQNLCTAVNQ